MELMTEEGELSRPTGTVFAWPNPRLAGIKAPPLDASPACEIIGLNNQRVLGRLTRFAPDEKIIHVQLNQARRSVILRFDQFRMLALMEPLVLPRGVSKPAEFDIVWTDGSAKEGQTEDWQEHSFGIFLFLPQPPSACVRSFIPRESFRSAKLRPAIDAAASTTEPQRQPPPAQEAGSLAEAAAGEWISTEVVTPEELLDQLEMQSRMPIVRIGQALTSLGMITDDDLRAGLARQQVDRDVPLGETLVRMGVVTPADLQIALVRKMGYPLVNLEQFPVTADALRKISFQVASRLQVMPLMVHEGRLILALDDPANRHSAVDEVEFIAQMKVAPVLGRCSNLTQVLQQAYEKIGVTEAKAGWIEPGNDLRNDNAGTTELLQTLEKEGVSTTDEDAPIEQSDNSLVRLINRMILEAYREGASDIHIESYPGREKIRIRFRRDGRLFSYLELPSNYRSALIARVKIMCDLDISEKRKPQDGKINFSKFSPQHRIELRVATIPTANGLEDVVMRILASAKPIPLDGLGFSKHNLAELKAAVERPYGMVLCVGPTGSGKTTTLHSALMHINTPERKIWTAEDPIEIVQSGLRQVQVNPRIDWTFAKALRAFVRADPDVIMVGEIRDEETAKTAIEASLTGHLVLSTLHTNSAPETVTRLLDMGMDPFNFADSLLAVLAQRLVRRLCSKCRVAHPATWEHIEELLSDYLHAYPSEEAGGGREALRASWIVDYGQDGVLMTYSAPGCKTCGDTGYKGRLGIHELMVMSRELRRLVQNGARAEELLNCALVEGMHTLRQDGIKKVLAGHTTIEEVRATSNV